MRVPNRLIGTTAKILKDYYTHAQIDSRFLMCGFPAYTTDGNKEKKVTDWLVLGNSNLPLPMENFAELIEEFMEDEDFDRNIDSYRNGITVRDGQQQILDAFQKCKISYPITSLQTAQVPEMHAATKPKSLSPQLVPPREPTKMTNSLFENDKVFIVHGHDNTPKHEAARTLTDLGLVPIILAEQSNSGRTIIEKFEHHSKVGFALILMTADDLGGLKAAGAMSELRPRARQNVVLELGFFVGKLGRNKVCVLLEEGVEPPSDIHGIVYTPLDKSGHWKLSLGKELKAAGYNVDLNRL
ncbi:TIR domain-containing protein [Pelagimonas varians]|uniref:Putative nucleotide-binding protein containing TIR-like domain protein n=1 Tax=Pelagimonas varians TaxID=696760 RepID=A0A238JY57_9RHOB|nr:nucleotide-binding protein [Pelagimonas varians]PYG33074.1 putative nucleotide-binding protein with TIR-like domain [Pelagimonas varians]SMX35601.1 putative nucleotide-binding protein containing TIR-like domain protein [Pelagimonas varians]